MADNPLWEICECASTIGVRREGRETELFDLYIVISE
jgi:hypothetical protein